MDIPLWIEIAVVFASGFALGLYVRHRIAQGQP